MRISIISDVHLGFSHSSEKGEDSFEGFREALEKSMGCDLILLAGDLFDSRSPSTETLTRCMESLIRPIAAENGTRLVGGMGKDVGNLTPLHQQGIPVVAIHGTHERRVRGLINPIQAMEKAGFLIYLHVNGVVLEKSGEQVCIQGMSGVPDQFSEAVLDRWRPKPRKGCVNILMIHQSVESFMYASHLLPLGKIPKGFDLYVLGHVHESRKSEYSGSPLLIPGSIVTTQQTREAVAPRGFWIFDTKTGDSLFMALDSQRRFFYLEHEGDQERLESDLEKLLEHPLKKKPLIRIKGSGLDIQGLNSRFGDRAIISVSKEVRKLESRPLGVREHKLSVQELGRKLLRQNLEESGLDQEAFEGVFDLLVHGKPEDALRLLSPERQVKQ
jgi:DNA repair exonuclease SbcCD nuclease subunit